MNRIIRVFLLFVGFSVLIQGNSKNREPVQQTALIPQPAEVIRKDGTFLLNAKTKIACKDELIPFAEQLEEMISPSTGFHPEIINRTYCRNSVSLLLDSSLVNLGEEGYTLDVQRKNILITACAEPGIFYGIQSLRQLLPPEIENSETEKREWRIQCLSITDFPQFKWRGLMLDCSRTFWKKDFVKRTIRLLALYKMNVLHLHLTDDQGWRIEIDKYPELTVKGARFPEKWNEPPETQGFYSKNDIREIVEYGIKHNVEIIPEIEMPGHTFEVLACYPELSCTGGPFEIHPFFKGPGIHEDILCAGNEKTFEFIENVLTEVFEIFPSVYIHIGGDEAPKTRWEKCSKCQERIKNEGLADEHELQSWFIKRVEKFANSKGKKIIGWDEILEGGLSKTASVMYWRGWIKDVPEKVINMGNNIVFCPTTHCYFDYKYENISSLKAYEFEPALYNISGEQEKQVLGVQANFWSHIDRTEAGVDKQLFPRILSIAETAWSMSGTKDSIYFKEKVQNHLKRLSLLGVHYYPDSTIILNQNK